MPGQYTRRRFLGTAAVSLAAAELALVSSAGAHTRRIHTAGTTTLQLTNTAVSSSRLYRENKLPFFLPMGVAIPMAVSAFPDEVYQLPRSWAEQAYPNLIHYNRPAKGGHFAAWEQPQLLVEEVRTGFKSLRS